MCLRRAIWASAAAILLLACDDADVPGGLGPDAGAAADAESPDAGDPPKPHLYRVEPETGGASVGTQVVIHGRDFGEVASVTVGGAPATGVSRVDDTKIAATFPPVPLTERGVKAIRVEFVGGHSEEQAEGFEYVFDEDPVVFVHGYMRDEADFDDLREVFAAAGYPADQLFAISFRDPYGSNTLAAQELADFVAQALSKTGAPRVDLVTHSMGGVAGRLFVKKYGGADKVRDFATLAGSHHGAFMYWPVGKGGEEMASTYACEGVQLELNGCLTASGRSVAADETPGGVEDGGGISYLSLWSEADDVLVPIESPCLNMKKQGDCTDPVNVKVAGLRHLEFLTDAGVAQQALAHVRKHNRSR